MHDFLNEISLIFITTLYQHAIDPKFVDDDVGYRADPLLNVRILATLSDVRLEKHQFIE